MEAKITRTKGTQDFEPWGGGQTYIGNGIIAREILRGVGKGHRKATERTEGVTAWQSKYLKYEEPTLINTASKSKGRTVIVFIEIASVKGDCEGYSILVM